MHASKQSAQIMPLRSVFISLLHVAASFSERDKKECVWKDAHELQTGDVAKGCIIISMLANASPVCSAL